MPCKATNARGLPCKKSTKNEYCTVHQGHQGDGIFRDAKDYTKRLVKKAVSPIKKFVGRRITAIKEGPATKPTSRLEKFLDTHQGRITKLEVGRKPILSPVKKAMDILSLGNFSKRQGELKYDDVYHQYMLVTLEDGKTYKLEKNHVCEFFPAKASDYKGEHWDIPIGDSSMTMKSMIDNASRGNESNFWKYRSGSDNCQAFTRDMVVKNGLLPAESMPIQDAAALTDSLPPYVNGVPNLVTDIAATADRLIHGDGVEKVPFSQRKRIHAALFHR
jgi:hypothetical protein